MKIEVIRADSAKEQHEIVGPSVMAEIEKLIGADTLDIVNLHDGRVMIVDDNGYECDLVDRGAGHFEMVTRRALKPVNADATKLYHGVCREGTTHQIVGDVAIALDADFA